MSHKLFKSSKSTCPGDDNTSRRVSGFSTNGFVRLLRKLTGSWRRRLLTRIGERSGYQFDSDVVKGGRRRSRWRRKERSREEGLREGIQFPSSRGWRAAHTLPFGAVTPRELWSPNEWLGRAKRRITYFFFSRFSALFQDVYKYRDRTCLPLYRPSLVPSLFLRDPFADRTRKGEPISACKRS